jgi:hypothetical protein
MGGSSAVVLVTPSPEGIGSPGAWAAFWQKAVRTGQGPKAPKRSRRAQPPVIRLSVTMVPNSEASEAADQPLEL